MKLIKILFLGLLLPFVIVNCKDDYEADEEFPQGSDFKIVNAAANITRPLAVYVDDNKIIDQNLYNTATSYYRVNNGSHTIKFNATGATGDTNLLTISDNFELNKNVTYFLLNSSATSQNLEFVKVYDDIIPADYNKSKIRLANFSYDLSENVDVISGGTLNSNTISNGTVVLSNISSKNVTSYVTVDSGNALYLVKTGTKQRVLTIAASNVKSRGVYTMLLTGYSTKTPALSFVANSDGM